MGYKCFSDAVFFDTTFQTISEFEMPFAPILGTNHHKQTIIFGCVLMFNETIPSFVWLFESFLKSMCGNHLSTIFTDQDTPMAATIAHVFPNTAHHLCLWHISQNSVKHLGPMIKAAEDEA
jgi:zinc finger SWIM domain-containing protein 3